jgi:hypothetical protein
MNVTSFGKRDYDSLGAVGLWKNKPNSKPNGRPGLETRSTIC